MMARKSHRLFQTNCYMPMTGGITHPMFECHQIFERRFLMSLLPNYLHRLLRTNSYMPITGGIAHPMFQCHQNFQKHFLMSLLPN